MLQRTAGYCGIVNLTLLMLYFGSHDAASLRTKRSSAGEPTNETISLPGSFRMVLSLKGGINQFGANILFNNVTFQKLYTCLCHKDTYSCSGNVTYNYGTSYDYNTGNIETVQTSTAASTAASMSTKYNCEVPNFGFLANNGGGYFSCVRAESADSTCTTNYWSIHIGQCDLGSAKVVWDAKHQASWNYTFSRNTPNRTVVSSCVCGAHGESSCDSRKAFMSITDLTTAQSDTITTNVITSTTNSTTPYLKEANSDSTVIGGTVGGLLVAAVVLLVVIIWRYRVFRKKNNADKDINKLTANEQFRKDNRSPPPQIPTRGRDSKPASLFVIPERGQKPDNDFPRWNHSGRKEDDEAASSIYCVIGSGVYENDISMNDNTSNNNHKNNSDEKVNKRIIDSIVNNKNPFNSSINTDNKPFNLTVTNNNYVPGYSKFGNKDNLIHNSQNNLPKPKQDIKQRQRQPIPIEELIPASQDSNDRDGSAYSLGRHFQQNYNFLNRPIESRRIANANTNSGAPTGENNLRRVNSLSSQTVYPLNIEDHASDGSRYFSLDHDLFQYNDTSESGGSRTMQASFHDSFVNPRGGQ